MINFKLNKIINNFLLAGDKFVPGLHLTKHREEVKNLENQVN